MISTSNYTSKGLISLLNLTKIKIQTTKQDNLFTTTGDCLLPTKPNQTLIKKRTSLRNHK